MTALVTPMPATRPVRLLVPVLAAHEALRLLLHPVMLAGFVVFFLVTADMVVSGTSPLEAFEGVGSMLGFYPGVFAILAANLVATRDLRAGSQDLLAPVPARPAERVAALSLAAIAPALVAAVLVVALDAYFLFDNRLAEAPTLWHLAQGPVAVLGGSLLGIMQWGEWGPYNGDLWVGFLPGSPAGHIVYLAGLCGMAASAAQFRVTRRRPTVVVLGLLSLAVATAGGILQLP
jgi:hypothetical protein